MPGANIRGGKKYKRAKKHKDNNEDQDHFKLEYASEGQIYALAKKKLGGKRIEVECSDQKIRSAIIPGKLWRKVWINPGDVLLCDLETIGNDNNCYIIQKYDNKSIHALKSQRKINFDVETNEEADCKFDDPALADEEVEPQRNLQAIEDFENDDLEEEEDEGELSLDDL